MDHVLQETERNRQMANQIAYRTFAANGVNDGVFPTGPKVCVLLGQDFVNYLVMEPDIFFKLKCFSVIFLGLLLTYVFFHISHWFAHWYQDHLHCSHTDAHNPKCISILILFIVFHFLDLTQ